MTLSNCGIQTYQVKNDLLHLFEDLDGTDTIAVVPMSIIREVIKTYYGLKITEKDNKTFVEPYIERTEQ